MSGSLIPHDLRKQIDARDGGRCGYCRLKQWGQGATFHVDHILPRSAGGTTSLENLALLCPHCNLRKASKVTAVDPVSGQRVRLFHPLSDRWEEHFESDVGGQCRGKTPVGRGTVDALAMNDALACRARAIQTLLEARDERESR